MCLLKYTVMLWNIICSKQFILIRNLFNSSDKNKHRIQTTFRFSQEGINLHQSPRKEQFQWYSQWQYILPSGVKISLHHIKQVNKLEAQYTWRERIYRQSVEPCEFYSHLQSYSHAGHCRAHERMRSHCEVGTFCHVRSSVLYTQSLYRVRLLGATALLHHHLDK